MSPFDSHHAASDAATPLSSEPRPATHSASRPASLPESLPEIVVYGTAWCGDCRRARRVFAELNVAYRYVDIEEDDAATQLVMRLNGGMRSVPTILFPDGGHLVEPRNAELEARLRPYADE